MTMLRRKFAVAIAHETVPGVAETLEAGDLIPNCYDADIQPEIAMEPRDGGGASLSPRTDHAGTRTGTCTFTVELTGDADPAWAESILPALGLGGGSGSFELDSRPPNVAGSTARTVTVGVYRDGKLKQLAGAMGTGVFRFASGGRKLLEVTLTGKWLAPTNVATPAPGLLTPIRYATATVTIGTFVPRFSEVSVTLNNEVVMREDPSDVSGYAHAVITGRRIVVNIDSEATLTGTHGASIYNPHADMIAETLRAFSTACGGVTLAGPAAQVINAQEATRNNMAVDNVELLLVRDADAGDDEFSVDVPTT